MNPPRPVVNLRDRDWRTQLKAALDFAMGDATIEPVPERHAKTIRGLK